MAREAAALLAATDQTGRQEVVIQCYHLLAELHYDHAYFPDSVGIYQRRAAELITADTPVAIRAENLIGLSLDQVYNYTFTTQVTAARLGKQLLGELPHTFPDKYARLLVAEGLGIKKYADQQSGKTRKILWKEAAAHLDEAAVLFRKIGSIRWREAQREKIIVLSRFKDRQLFEREMDLLRSHDLRRAVVSDTAGPPPFGFPDRLTGYFHHQQGAVDSVLHYYLRFQREMPMFDFHLRDETFWTLIQYGMRAGDLDLAERNVRDQFVLYKCCDGKDKNRSTMQLIEGFGYEFFGCYYAMSDYGRIQLARYQAGRGAEYLLEADRIFSTVLDQWEMVFRTGEAESARGQLDNITYKIVQNANEVAWERYGRDATTEAADDLLQSMERTKSFLLLADRLAVADSSGRKANLDSLRHWQSEIDMLKAQEFGGPPLSTTERQRMLSLNDQHRDLMRVARDQKLGAFQEEEKNPLTTGGLQRLTADRQATLIFAEGNNRLLAQYVDVDTVIAYASPPVDVLRRKVDTLLTLLESGQRAVSVAAYAKLAGELYGELLGPISSQLNGRTSLLVVPAGPLRRLPFGALVAEVDSLEQDWNGLAYLVKQLEISYTPSLRVELLNRTLRRSATPAVAVGTWIHPELKNYFDADAANQQPPSAGSRAFLEGACSATTFRRQLDKFEIIDLAIHAAGDPLNPYNNYLYFTPTDSLNGAAVAQLDCHASLVVLNACQTGIGTGTIGEGTFSIARSFQQLGVPDVIYSLWRIPAAASAELREGFYQALYAGASPSRALTLTQREFAGSKRYAFPGSWAGLVKG